MMNAVSCLWMLANFYLLIRSLGCLKLENEEVICMYIEGLAISLCCQLQSISREKQLVKVRECVNLGDTYYSMGDYSKAMKYFQTSLVICELNGYKEGKEMVYRGLGHVSLQIGEHDNSIRYLHKALNIAMEIEKGMQCMAAVYGILGDVYLAMSELDKAMEYYQQRLEIALEIGDKNLQSLAYINIGIICISRCEYNEAIENLDKGVKIVKQLGDKNNEAVGYLNLGVIYYLLGDYSKAIKYYQTSLDIYAHELTGDKIGKEYAYRGLGITSCQMGKYNNGITYLNKALNIAMKIEDRHRNIKIKYLSLLGLEHLYQTLGRNREAIPYFLKSLKFTGAIKDRGSQMFALDCLGFAYCSIGNTKKAMEYQEEHLKLSTEFGYKNNEVAALYGLAYILYFKSEYSKAITYLLKSLEITNMIDDKVGGQASIFALLGVCHLFLKNCKVAILYLKKSLNIAREMKEMYNEVLANLGLALTYFRLTLLDNDLISNEIKNFKKSEVYSRKAIEVSDWLFHHLHNRDDFQISLFKQFQVAYSILTEVLIETQQKKEALLKSERGRGRFLTDLLISKYFISHEVAVASPFSNYDEVQAFLSRNKLCILFYTMACRYIIWVFVQNEPVFYHIQGSLTWESFVPKSKNERREFLAIECEYEAYVEKLVGEAYDKMRVKDAGLKCEDRSLDAYKSRGHVDEDDVVTTTCSEQDTKESSIGNKASLKRLPLEESSAATTNVQDNRDPLEKLFDVIIAPVQSRLTTEEYIVIIPQGPLYLVPFPALRNPKTRLFLIETHRIRLAPSLSALKTWQECPADYHSAEGALVIGNPKVGKVMLRGEERILGSLPRAQDEAEYIAERLGVTALTGSQATKEEVKSRLAKGVAVIHIAAHGDPRRGEIALAPSESAIQKGIPEEEDYLLTMREVQQIGIRAKLVVLSCCHSGRGDIEPEGVVGMSRAFLAAGARAVIASLWHHTDDVTYHFMMKLYIELGKGHSASASLQQTMKFMQSQLGYTDPKDWASFYLIGDDVTIT